ncbi:PREDICTED: protein CHUP1, chloroplastic isoform X2 [Nelumbo nucifera]|uniref:Protein CHUP1, chloroplastic isoform X2 n=1 Tax=Nelumbo nucifera TaxID=4432 RepID=A0A1U7YNE4_NELNU|nr:PREDICTED: protein CHUP1, chloroplastic isoform X2 [Nelumbo nucifera]
MKQEISKTTTSTTEGKPSSSQSTTPSRLRTSSKAKSSPRSDARNGVSPSLRPRPKSVPLDPNNNGQKVRRPLGFNRPKSNEDAGGPQKGGELDDVKIAVPSVNRPLAEHLTRSRRRVDPSCKRNEDDPDGKRKELQDKLLASENLVKDLQSEMSALKSQLEKLQTLNVELESQNRQFAEDLAAAEAKISALATRNKESIEEKFQSPKFKDVQKFIANKLEHSRSTEAIKDGSTVKSPSIIPSRPVMKALDAQQKVLVNSVPLPPPPSLQQKVLLNSIPPPPPPPPPPRAPSRSSNPQKASSLVEFYHSLTKHEGKKDTSGPGRCSNPMVNNAHNSIVGEIQNRSAHLLAIKADVETKGEFIKSLIQKVQEASYTDIGDVLKFVDWLDGELSSLADERAVLKHFNWPERKADAMREAAVEYRDLKRLESELSSYNDDNSMPCDTALKKMGSLLDKSERSIQRLVKLRDAVILSYRDCKVPTDWMLDTGMISKIKQASMKLTKMYMKRVSLELESIRNSERESTQEALLLQGVRFAYRAHQFAGGLDSETMCAFEEIRQRVPTHLGGSRELLAGIASS